MEKIDHKKEFKELYKPPKKPTTVDVPEFNFIMVDGKGDPNTSKEYQDAVGALYSVGYTVKFAVKKIGTANFTVLPLEGLWWLEGETELDENRKDDWSWTAMIMQPEYVTKELFNQSLEQVAKKKKLPALSKMRFESLHEGLSAQIMHLGPFSAEGPSIEKLHDFIKENGYEFDGLTQKHHEIYLSDVRRVSPEKMRTIIRQPMKRKD